MLYIIISFQKNVEELDTLNESVSIVVAMGDGIYYEIAQKL